MGRCSVGSCNGLGKLAVFGTARSRSYAELFCKKFLVVLFFRTRLKVRERGRIEKGEVRRFNFSSPASLALRRGVPEVSPPRISVRQRGLAVEDHLTPALSPARRGRRLCALSWRDGFRVVRVVGGFNNSSCPVSPCRGKSSRCSPCRPARGARRSARW
jgi:hypothetical protein